MKRIVSIFLVGTLATVMSAGVFAAKDNKNAKYTEMNMSLGYSYRGQGNLSADVLDLDEIYAHNEVEIELPLCSEMFAVADGISQPAAGTRLTATDIRKSKIMVRYQTSAGSKAVKDVSIDTRKSAVIIQFVDEWVSTKEQEFEIYVYLTINGRRQSDYGLTVTGTLTNPVIEVFSDFDHVDLSEGYVAEAQDFVSNIEVELGNGVSLYTKFFKGKKYYGTASRSYDEAADVVMRQHPDIDNIIVLKTVGLNSTGDIVRLSTDYTDYYVYDKDLNYIGQSNEMLPFSAVYYLANRKLEIDDNEDEEPEDEEDEPDDIEGTNPGTGGDNNASNANANPGTGC